MNFPISKVESSNFSVLIIPTDCINETETFLFASVTGFKIPRARRFCSSSDVKIGRDAMALNRVLLSQIAGKAGSSESERKVRELCCKLGV